MTGPDIVVEARRALGRQLAAYRRAAGLSQHQLADSMHYGRSTIANVETGRQNVGREFWQQGDGVLQASGVLVEGYERSAPRLGSNGLPPSPIGVRSSGPAHVQTTPGPPAVATPP